MTNRILAAIRGNIVAWVALFVALGGTSLAASHYVISSTKQIKPTVLSQLRGRPGRLGATGVPGTAGSIGATGAIGNTGATGHEGPKGGRGEKGEKGEPGPFVNTLPSGKTETGSFAGGQYRPVGAKEPVFVVASISYQFPLASEPQAEVVQKGAASTSNCPGSSGAPSATAGHLCVYVTETSLTDPTVEVEQTGDANKDGTRVFGKASTDETTGQIWGTWAV